MKNNYNGFKGWIRYIRDYKQNVENAHQYNEYIDERSQLQEQLNQAIFDKNMYEIELLEIKTQKDQKIKTLKSLIRREAVDKTTCQNAVHLLTQQVNELKNKIKEKELLRRKTAGQVGGLKAKISVLKKDLARANQKINWLSNNQKAPTKEEIIAYELQMKEVEKKLKKDID